jgi:hypothetical protein
VRSRSLLWLLPVTLAAALVAALDARAPDDVADIPFFLSAADTLFSARWLDTFAGADLQAGPLQLLLLGAGERLATAFGVSALGFLAFAVEIAVALLLVYTVGKALEGRRYLREAQLGVGLAAVALGLTSNAYGYGHPAQVVVPLAWILAARLARRADVVPAGLLVGTAAGLETWAVLGLPVLLLAPSRRDALRGLATCLATAAALFVPFAALGSFAMFDYTWKVSGWAPLSVLLGEGADFSWPLRLLQAGAAVGAGAGAAVAFRARESAIWVVPLVVVVVRLALDPTLYPWYWLALETVALVGAADLATGGLLRRIPAVKRPAPAADTR